ncbi:MAG: type I-MYXAN CRISPR-associated protein Cas6/Cmx6 [Bdellovibrio bacteriovorus]
MFWNQDVDKEALAVPEDVADVVFTLDCRQLPVDHAHALSEALTRVLPWMSDEPLVAVHTIHVAGSQNGWERPAHGTENRLLLSRRTRLVIRTPQHRIGDLLAQLPGTNLEVGGCPMAIGEGRTKPLSRETTLFARYVVSLPGQDEERFLANAARALGEMGIGVRKALCGKSTPLETPSGPLHTRSLLLADLSLEESFLLQRLGLGPGRLMGCGVFIPHKGVDPVAKAR